MRDQRVTELVAQLTAEQPDYPAANAAIASWAKTHPHLLADAAREVQQSVAHFHFAERMLRTLCFEPSEAATAAVLDLAPTFASPAPHRTRSATSWDTVAASWLSNHGPARLRASLVERGAEPRLRHLFACWAQELVVRGHSFAGEAHVEVLWDGLRQAKTALAALPVALLPIEAGFAEQLPRETPTGSGHGVPFYVDDERLVPDTSGPVSMTQLAVPPSLKSAFSHWETTSAGTLELGVFALAPAAATIDARLLGALPMASTKGRLGVNALAPRTAVTWVFAAASQSPMYGDGLRGAYGRLAAWRSVQGFTGVGEPFELTRLAAAAERCAWATYLGDSGWFSGILEIGLGCLREGGASLAVVAGSDVD